MRRRAVRGGMLGMAWVLGACASPDGSATAAKTGESKVADLEAPETRVDDAKASGAAVADGKADDGKANDGKANDGKANDGKANDASAPDAGQEAPEKPAEPDAAPSGPVLVDGELSLAAEHIGDIHLGTSAADLIAKLGKPKKKDRIEEEGATGDWVQDWEYPKLGLSVGMASDTREGPQRVRSLTANASCTLTASWGLGIGSTRAEVEKVYDDAFDPDFTNEDSFVAGSVYGGVFYDFADGKVTRIFIGAGAE